MLMSVGYPIAMPKKLASPLSPLLCLAARTGVSSLACQAYGMLLEKNDAPLRMQFGYTVYRRVLGYYSGEEDAFDMRKAMPRDVLKRSVVPLKRPVKPEELECD